MADATPDVAETATDSGDPIDSYMIDTGGTGDGGDADATDAAGDDAADTADTADAAPEVVVPVACDDGTACNALLDDDGLCPGACSAVPGRLACRARSCTASATAPSRSTCRRRR